jgi:hypothetical protein
MIDLSSLIKYNSEWNFLYIKGLPQSEFTALSHPFLAEESLEKAPIYRACRAQACFGATKPADLLSMLFSEKSQHPRVVK